MMEYILQNKLCQGKLIAIKELREERKFAIQREITLQTLCIPAAERAEPTRSLLSRLSQRTRAFPQAVKRIVLYLLLPRFSRGFSRSLLNHQCLQLTLAAIFKRDLGWVLESPRREAQAQALLREEHHPDPAAPCLPSHSGTSGNL